MTPRRARPRPSPPSTARTPTTVRWRDDDTGHASCAAWTALPSALLAASLFASLPAHAVQQADTPVAPATPASRADTSGAPAPAAQEPASSPRRPGETTTGRVPAPAQPAPATTPAAAAPAAPLPGDAVAGPAAAGPAASTTTTAPNTAPAARPAPQVALASPPSPAGGLLQTIMALLLVLGLLAGLAWLLKRYGPRTGGGGANLRVVGALNIGGRERIMVVEVGDQWIVVGAAPGRVNALHTMPRQEGVLAPAPGAGAVPANSFPDWLKNTIDKRNAT